MRRPQGAPAAGYSGSLVNLVTAAFFLETAAAQGHSAAMATAGSSTTGHALAALARSGGVPALILVRSRQAGAAVRR